MAIDRQDVSLLFGVSGGGSVSGESGQLIKSQIESIATSLNNAANSKQRQLKFNLDIQNTQSSFTQGLKHITEKLSGQSQLKIKISELDATSAISKFKVQLETMLRTLKIDTGFDVSIGSDGATSAIKEISDESKEAATHLNEVAAKLKEIELVNKSISSAYGKVRNALGGDAATGENLQAVNELRDKYTELQTAVENLRAKRNRATEEDIQNVYNLRSQMESLLGAQREHINASKENTSKEKKEEAATLKQIVTLYEQINNYIAKAPKAESTEQGKDLVRMKERLIDARTAVEDTSGSLEKMSKVEMGQLQGEFAALKSDIKGAGLESETFSQSMSKALQRFTGWALATKALTVAIQQIKKMVTHVREIDAAMTELKKVTDETDATYARFLTNAATRAKTLGATLSDTIIATGDFARLGFGLSDASSLADAALIYKNVGDGIRNVSDASESIISTMKAFGIEASEAMSIVDKFNETGNRFAITSQGVGESLKRAASSLAAANNTIDQSIGMIVAANNVIQNPEIVGNAVRTIAARLRNTAGELQDLGEDADGAAESVTKLQQQLLQLTDGRVNIMLDASTFRSTYDILLDLSEVWDDLSDKAQADIVRLVAGVRQGNVLSALMQNMKEGSDAVAVSLGSAGSAMEENEKFLDSINGKIAIFTASFQQMSVGFIDSGLVKGIIDLGTGTINLINNLGGLQNILGIVIGLLILIKQESAVNGFIKILDSAKKLVVGIKEYAVAQASANAQMASGKSAAMGLGDSLSAVLGVVGLVVIAFSAVKMGVDAVNRANEEAREKAKDAAKSLSEQSASLEETKNRANELREALDYGNLSYSEANEKRRELYGIQEQLIKRYGREAEAIDLVTGSINKQIDALDKAAYLEFEQENKPQIDAAVKALETYETISNRLNTNEMKGIEQYKGVLEKYGMALNSAPVDFNSLRQGSLSPYVLDVGGTPEERLAAYRDLYDEIEEMSKSAAGEEKKNAEAFLLALNKMILGVKQRIADHTDVYATHIAGTILLDEEYSKTNAAALEARSELYQALLDGDAKKTKEAFDNLMSILDDAIANTGDNDGVSNYFKDMKNAAEDAIPSLEKSEETIQSIKDLLGKWGNAPKGLVSDHILASIPVEYLERVRDVLGDINDEEDRANRGRLIADAFDSGLFSSQDLNILINNYERLGIVAGDSFEAMQEKIRKFKVSEGYFTSLSAIVAGVTDDLSLLDVVARDFGEDIYLKEGTKEFEDYQKSLAKLKETYPEVYKALVKYNQSKTEHNKLLAESAIRSAQERDAAKQAGQSYEDNISALEGLLSVQKDLNDGSQLSYSKMIDLITEYPQLASSIKLAEKGYILEGSALKDLIELKKENLRLNMEERRQSAGTTIMTTSPASQKTVDNFTKMVNDGTITSGQQWLDSLPDPSRAISGMKEYIDELVAAKKITEGLNNEFETFFGYSESSRGSSSSSKPKLPDPLDYSNFFNEQIKDLEKALEPIDKEIERILGEISVAEAVGNADLVSSLTAALINARNIRKSALEEMLAETKAITEKISNTFKEFADVDMSDYGIEKYRQTLGNQITALQNANDDDGKNDTQIRAVENTLARFNEFVSAYQAGQAALDNLQSQINQSANDLLIADLKEADKRSQGLLDSLKEAWGKRSISEDEFLSELEALMNDPDISMTQKKNITDVYQEFLDGEFGRIKKEIERRETLLLPDDFEGQIEIALEKIAAAEDAIAKAAEGKHGEGSPLMDSLRDYLMSSFDVRSQNTLSALTEAWEKRSIDEEEFIGELERLMEDPNISGSQRQRIVSTYQTVIDETYGRIKQEIERRENLLLPDDFDGQAKIALEKIAAAKDAIAKALEGNHGEGSPLIKSFRDDIVGGGTDYTSNMISSLELQYDKTNDIAALNKGLHELLEDENLSLRDRAEILNVINNIEDRAYNRAKSRRENDMYLYKQNSAVNGEYDSQVIINYYRTAREESENAQQVRRRQLAELGYMIEEIEADSLMQGYQRDWWDAFHAENTEIADRHQRWFDNQKKAIDLLEYNDTDKRELIRYWQGVLEGIAYEIESFNGKTDDFSKKRIEELTKDMRDVKQIISKTLDDIVTSANAELDKVQSVFDTLKGAAKEFGENGFITIDTFQKIASLGVEYLSVLQDENGQLIINEEVIKNVIAAKTQQTAVETALNYVRSLGIALEEGKVDELNRLLYATDGATKSTWGFVYASLALLKLDDSQYQAAKARIDALKSLADTAVTSIGKVTGELSDSLKEQESALDNLLKYVTEMIKWEVNNQIKGLKDQVTQYKNIVNLQKESLRLAKEKDNYDKNVQNRIKEIAALQNRINQLALDDSREAQAERKKLEEQLYEHQEGLVDFQSDYQYNAQADTLDKMADAFSKEKDEEIKILEESISSTEKLYRLSIERISTQWDTLYQSLLDWNYQAGNSTEQNLVAAWDAASGAVQRYGSYLEAVLQTQNQIAMMSNNMNGLGSVTSGGYDSNDLANASNAGSVGFTPPDNSALQKQQAEADARREAIDEVTRLINSLQSMSAQWHVSAYSPAEQARLAEAALDIGAQIAGLLKRPVLRGKDGHWYLDRVGGEKLYDAYNARGVASLFKYHTGTMSVGSAPTLKDNEIMAVLEKKEAVLDEQKKEGLYKIIDFVSVLSERLGRAIDVGKLNSTPISSGRILPSLSELQPTAGSSTSSIEFSPEINVTVEYNGDADDESARRFGRSIGEGAIERLNEAAGRRGIGTLIGSSLRS